MSDKNQESEMSRAITSSATRSENVLAQQPRQPQSLQGLLRFAMEATKAEDAPGESNFQPLDEERKKFLEDALKSMTVDVIEILLKSIQKLKGSADVSLDSDVTEYVQACESIMDFVDRIDTAVDFHKIGGYEIFQPCFSSVHGEIRAKACSILGDVCQNLPYCQDRAVENGYVRTLLDLIDNDPDSSVTHKAIYALSCLLRGNQLSITEFRKENGISVLIRALHKPIIKIRIKVCFLLNALCIESAEILNDLINADYIQLLITLLTEDRTELQEHVLGALNNLLYNGQNKEVAISECRQEKYGLVHVIKNYLQQIEKSDAEVEIEYCRNILNVVSPTHNNISIER